MSAYWNAKPQRTEGMEMIDAKLMAALITCPIYLVGAALADDATMQVVFLGLAAAHVTLVWAMEWWHK